MQITITIPDELAKRAQSAGILIDETFETLLAEQVERAVRAREAEREEGLKQFGEIMDALQALEPPITEAEVDAVLAERKQERLREAGII